MAKVYAKRRYRILEIAFEKMTSPSLPILDLNTRYQ